MYKSSIHFRLVLLLVLLFTALSCKKSSAPSDAPIIETKISGTVTNKVSGAAIQGAQITTTPITSTITSDDNGKYEFTAVAGGSYVITATKSGFKDSQTNVTVAEGSTAKADIQIEELTGRLDVSPVFLDFGTADNQKVFAISNATGIGTINYTITKNAGWLTLSEAAGSITTNVKNITLTVDRTQLTYGNSNDVITIASNVGNVIVNAQIVKQNPNSPQLTLSPIILDFGTSQSELNITMSNTGTGAINWNAATTDGWISIVPASGTINSNSVTTAIRVNRTGLPPNNLTGSVIFTSNGGNQTISVKMSIPSTPVISLNPSILDFGTSDSVKTIQVSNIGAGSLNWSITSNQSWLTVTPTTGTNSSVVTLNIQRGSLAVGTYSGSLSFVSNGGNIKADVSMTVPAPMPPDAVTLSTPSNISINSCKLVWTASSAADFASYKIYKSTSADVNESSTLVTTITNSATTNFTVTGLSGSTTYYFRVYVVNSKGISAGSNVVSASTLRQLGSWMATSTIPGIISSGLNPNSLFCISDNNVWLSNSSNIWHYSGSGWEIDNVFSEYISSIFFLNATSGWAVGKNGAIYSYNGSIWTKINSTVIGSTNLYDIAVISVNDIWVSGSGGLLFHYDGNAWTKWTIFADNLVSLSYLSKDNVWVMDSYYGKVFNYNGVGWASKGYVNGVNGYYDKIKVFSNTDIWISNSYYGSSAESGLWHYDGTTFSPNYKTTEANYAGVYALEMISATEGWASKAQGGLIYFDGNGWRYVSVPISSKISCIKMQSSKKGWAIGAGGEVLRYIEP